MISVSQLHHGRTDSVHPETLLWFTFHALTPVYLLAVSYEFGDTSILIIIRTIQIVYFIFYVRVMPVIA